MGISIHDAWAWVGKAGVPGVIALEEGARALIRHTRRRDIKRAHQALEKSGPGVGSMDFQVAEQWGWDVKKAQSVLRRLEKAGKAYQYDGRWYLSGAVVGRASRGARRG